MLQTEKYHFRFKSVGLLLVLLLTPLFFSCSRERGFPVTTSSPEARALWDQAVVAARNLEKNSAKEMLDSAIEFDSTFALAYALREIVSTSGREDLETARRLSENATEDERKFIEARYQERILLDRDTSLKILTDLSKKYPEDLTIRLLRDQLYQYLDTDESLAELEELQRDFPGSPAVQNLLGYVYYDLGDVDKAEYHFNRYIRLAPHLANPYDSMGDFLRMQGRYSDAIEYYRKALERDVSKVSLEKMVLCHAYMQNYDNAWQALNEGMSFLQDDPVLLHSIYARLNLLEENTSAAVEHMRQQCDAALAADDFETYSIMRGILALVFIYYGQSDEGMAILDSTDSFLVENVSGSMDINYVWDEIIGIKSYAAAKKGDFEQAHKYLKILQDKTERYKTTEDIRAGNPLESSQASVSVSLFGPSMSNQPSVKKKTAEIYYRSLKLETNLWKGMIAYFEGDYDQSCDILREMKEIYPSAGFWLAKAEIGRGNPHVARAELSALSSSGTVDEVFTLVYPEMQKLLKELSG